MKIALIGMMAVGKTTLGQKLASQTNLKFIDLDQEIETKIGMTISNFFNKNSEADFRKIERDVFASVILSNDNFIIATGGGAIANEDLFCNFDHVFWIRRDSKMIEKNDLTRPLITNYESLFRSRKPVYKKIATTSFVNENLATCLDEMINYLSSN